MRHPTWFVVADARRVRVLAYHPKGDQFDSPLHFDFVAPGGRDGDRFTDRAGRVSERKGPGRHAMEAPTPPNRHEEQEMARRVAENLAGLVHRHEIERLVLVAPPHMLGSLRKVLDGPTRSRVTAEHGKDLSKLSEHELCKRLRGLLTS